MVRRDLSPYLISSFTFILLCYVVTKQAASEVKSLYLQTYLTNKTMIVGVSLCNSETQILSGTRSFSMLMNYEYALSLLCMYYLHVCLCVSVQTFRVQCKPIMADRVKNRAHQCCTGWGCFRSTAHARFAHQWAMDFLSCRDKNEAGREDEAERGRGSMGEVGEKRGLGFVDTQQCQIHPLSCGAL